MSVIDPQNLARTIGGEASGNEICCPGPGKPSGDTSGERDLLLTALRVAATRTRLQTNVFDCVGVALRQKQVDCAGALAWLKDEGLLDHLPFGPGRRDELGF